MARAIDGLELFGELGLRLMRLAGYAQPDDVAKGGQYALEYKQILNALNFIGNKKVDEYGDFRLQDIRSWDRETWGAYWDVQRKFGRLEQQLNLASALVGDYDRGDRLHPQFETVMPKSVNDLMESCSDMAVYCVRMIQILRRLEEKGMVPSERLDHGSK